jgi:hypothetical protein
LADTTNASGLDATSNHPLRQPRPTDAPGRTLVEQGQWLGLSRFDWRPSNVTPSTRTEPRNGFPRLGSFARRSCTTCERNTRTASPGRVRSFAMRSPGLPSCSTWTSGMRPGKRLRDRPPLKVWSPRSSPGMRSSSFLLMSTADGWPGRSNAPCAPTEQACHVHYAVNGVVSNSSSAAFSASRPRCCRP